MLTYNSSTILNNIKFSRLLGVLEIFYPCRTPIIIKLKNTKVFATSSVFRDNSVILNISLQPTRQNKVLSVKKKVILIHSFHLLFNYTHCYLTLYQPPFDRSFYLFFNISTHLSTLTKNCVLWLLYFKVLFCIFFCQNIFQIEKCMRSATFQLRFVTQEHSDI